MEELQKLTLCAIWLIKTLCIDTNAVSAKYETNVIHEGKDMGRYKITIEKIK